jgi:hypothetical protein
MITKGMRITGVILAGLFFLPYGIGFLVEKRYPEWLSQLSAVPMMSQEAVSYQRGWFQSQAVSKIMLHGNMLQIRHRLFHGPFTVKGFGIAHIISEIMEPSGKSLPVTLHTKIGWMGKTTLQISSAPILLRHAAEDASLEITGLEGTWTWDGPHLTGHMNLPLLSWTVGPEERLHIESLKGEYNLRQHLSGVWLGEHHITLGFLATHHLPSVPDMQLRWLKSDQIISEETAYRMAIQWIGTAESLYWKQALYGPLQWDMNVDHLPLKKVDTWAEMVPLLGRTRPILSINQFKLDMPQGFLQGKARLAVGGNGENTLDLAKPETILRALEVSLQIEAPKRLVRGFYPFEEADRKLNQLEQLGWVRLTADVYTVDLSFRDNRLVVNGLEKPLPIRAISPGLTAAP